MRHRSRFPAIKEEGSDQSLTARRIMNVTSRALSTSRTMETSDPNSWSVPLKFQSTLDPWQDLAIGVFMLVVGVVSVVGNSIAIQVFRPRAQTVPSVPELLLFNVSIVNLLLAVATYPAAMISAFAHHWVFGEIGCKVYAAMGYFLGLATILSLATLALFRYIKTCRPNSSFWITLRNTQVCIGLIYVYSGVWALFPFVGWGGYDVEPFGLSCTLEWSNFDGGSRSHILTLSICCLLVPFLVITISHVAIFLRVRKAGDMLQNRETGRQTLRAEIQCYRVSFAVCGGFIIAWFPYACFSLWSAFGDTSAIPVWLTPLPVVLAKTSIAYNPLIYVALTERYRTAFGQVLRQWCCRPPRATGPMPTAVTENQASTVPERLLTVMENRNGQECRGLTAEHSNQCSEASEEKKSTAHILAV